MKRILAMIICILTVVSFSSCSKGDKSELMSFIPEIEPPICESSFEFIDNMTYGWNLGLSLSVYNEGSLLDSSGVFVSMNTSDGYNRSDVLNFNPETNQAIITWKIGTDGYYGSSMDSNMKNLGIGFWNFSLTDNDTVKLKVEAFEYTTVSGNVFVCDESVCKEYEMNISGGVGSIGSLIISTEDILLSNISEISATVSFVDCVKGESTPESIMSSQTAWGNPVTTQEMINAVRDKGFNLIRVQVSYKNHIDSDGNIDPLWLNRVVEVVDYCMNAQIYCLLTATGSGWTTAEPETFEEQSAIYRRIWEQVAARFVDYDDKLLFEGLNEVLPSGGWGAKINKKHFDVMESFCQVFVDTVRSSGGYNETRNLVINPIEAAYDYDTNKNFEMPKDSVDDHLIASVHCYYPQQFCFNETNLGSTDFRNEWGGATDEKALDSILNGVKKRFIDELEVPVLIGEFGVVDRASEEERAEYISFYSKTAENYGIKLVIFDDGGDFTVFERETLTWPYEKVIEALFSAEEINE